MHSKAHRVQDLVFQREGTYIGALDELAGFDRRLDRVIVGVLHGVGERSEVIFEDKAERFLKNLLDGALINRISLTAFHQILKVS